MDIKEVLEDIDFGDSIAEQEVDKLKLYFVTTHEWNEVFGGDDDIVYGPKGSGKSAIYSLLQEESDALLKRSITFIPAENPRGTLAFKELESDPPSPEQTFIRLWKLYLLCLIGEAIKKEKTSNEHARLVVHSLEASGFLQKRSSLSEILAQAFRYVKSWIKWQDIELGAELDPATSMPTGIKGKITFATPLPEQKEAGILSVDNLLDEADAALKEVDRKIWLGIDRLDVSFAENPTLEANALRSLFRTYLDLQKLSNISLKIFLRTDIWDRIIQEGFREASHITRTIRINWNDDLLLNLILRRALQSKKLCEIYSVDRERTLSDISEQKKLFYRIFPSQVVPGKRRPATLDWMISRVKDGRGYAAPRELIQLLKYTREAQIKELEIGAEPPPNGALFSPGALKAGLKPVSEQRLNQTLYAEYPTLKPFIEQLYGEKAEQTPDTLSEIWNKPKTESLEIADKLHQIGFFERRGSKDTPTFWVPFLYRDALRLVQGKAENE